MTMHDMFNNDSTGDEFDIEMYDDGTGEGQMPDADTEIPDDTQAEAPTPEFVGDLGYHTRMARIGGQEIALPAELFAAPVEDIRNHLRELYPEVAQAAHREHTKDGVAWLEFIPRAGKKG